MAQPSARSRLIVADDAELRRTLARRNRPRAPNGMLLNAADRMQACFDATAAIARLPVLDCRLPDEILGYDESGLPT